MTFFEKDGQLPHTPPATPAQSRQAVTLARLRDRYLKTHENGTIEANSLYTCRIHLSHFCRFFGEAFPIGELSPAKLQGYVDQRSEAKMMPATVRKEMATLRAAWNWGGPMGLTSSKFPNNGLRYPKSDEKSPFMTLDEVLKQVEAGRDPVLLWNSLYLHTAELAELLEHVKKANLFAWVYPLFCVAAHTGARRSELLRALLSDVDFDGETLIIREKKRTRERTTRRVPMTPFLVQVLKDWVKTHPGGQHLFCQAGEISRSKKRSRSTGDRGMSKRESSLKGRVAVVKKRLISAPQPLTRNEVHHHFKGALKGSKWENIRGLHTPPFLCKCLCYEGR